MHNLTFTLSSQDVIIASMWDTLINNNKKCWDTYYVIKVSTLSYPTRIYIHTNKLTDIYASEINEANDELME